MREPLVTIERDDGLGALNPVFQLDGKPWRLLRDGLDGFDGMRADVSSASYAQYDGAMVTSARFEPQDRSIRFAAPGDPGELRASVRSFFRPRAEYVVHVDSGAVPLIARGVYYDLSVATDNLTRAQSAEFTILCAEQPMLMSEDEKRFDIAEAVGHFGFPFRSFKASRWKRQQRAEPRASGTEQNHIRGMVCGLRSSRIEMVNGGDAEAYPRFDLYASADVADPLVTVEDASGAEVCRFGAKLTMHAGDVLTVDFSARPTAMELNGKNVSHLATPDSTLAAGIPVGRFAVRWSAKSGDAALSIKPSIRERYTAI